MIARRLLLFAVALLLPPLIHAGDGEVTFIHIGDLHGHLVPRPNMREGDETHGQMVGGLAYVYDQIKEIRSRHPNSLLINTGDTIQGSAEVLYSRGQHIIDILNEFKIDAFTPGNWDFVYGTERFIELFAGPKPITNWNAVAANLYYVTLYEFPLSPYPERAGTRVIPPYLIKQVGDVTVGILGLTADRGPQAVSTRIMDGFYLSPGEEELAQGVNILRNQEEVDLVVLISERGLAANLDMVERIPGVDLVLSSDMHEETHNVLVAKTGTLLVEEGQDGTLVGEITLKVDAGKISDWGWKAHRITTENNQPDPAIAAMVKNVRKSFVKGPDFHPHVNPVSATILRTPIDTVIGHTKVPLHRSNFTDATSMPAVIEGSSHNFLADAFKFACNADVGMMRGFRYGTHIAPGPIKLEDIYHYIPIGPQIACGKISGDELRLRIEKSADSVLTNWIGNWGGGWLIAFSGITYDLDPSNEYRNRVSNLRINGELLDPARMYSVAGYWYLDNADRINRMPAIDIRVLKDAYSGDVDATEIVAYYLQTLPSKTVNPELNRIRLTKPLPKPISKNKEIQPLKGYPRPEY
jgi:2',3'-cyclic-nucleotide 2'-phosphodiesterase (5'-nucleotidase family)